MNLRDIEPNRLKHIEERFTRLSLTRLEKMLSGYNLVQSDSIRILSLLFHENHPMLPGYIDKTAPCGLPSYFPSELDKKIAKTISRSFEFKNRAYLRYEIESLYLMGSTGTLGQSVHSDLDCWVCVADGLSETQLLKLQKKIDLISLWIKTRNIELNCYIVHHDDFINKTIKLSTNTVSQNHLLLDEFYRTAVWICGKKPLWWLIPPNENYQQTVALLMNKQYLYQTDWIDFGEVIDIPASEYFTAALWQQYKAIESPYKSSVKLLILEIYARNSANTGLLSHQFKTLVYDGIEDSEKLDPYLMVLEYAEIFLKDNPQRLEFLRRAFYLKTGIKINLKNKLNKWRYQQMYYLVERWQWKQTRLDFLNDRPNWKINVVIKERNDLIRELTHSYHFLSNFARIEGVYDESNQRELTYLGRKFHAIFERKSGKIEYVNAGIARNVVEPAITIFQKDETQWLLFLGSVSKNQLIISQSVHKTATLFELVVWCVCNKVVDKNTNYQIYADDQFYDRELVRKLVNDISDFGIEEPVKIDDGEYKKSIQTKKIAIYINAQASLPTDGKTNNYYSVTKATDCFSWGNSRVNLLDNIDLLFVNNWGEYCCKNYQGPLALSQLLSDHKHIIQLKNDLLVYSGKKLLTSNLTNRTKKLLFLWRKLISASQKERNQAKSKKIFYKNYRYLMSLANGFLHVSFVRGKITTSYHQHRQAFLSGLSLPSSDVVEYVVDDNLNLSEELLRVIKKPLTDGYHCYIIVNKNKQIEVIVTQPQGCIFYQDHQNISLDMVISHYQQFFDSVNQRLNFNAKDVSACQFWLLDLSQDKNANRYIQLKNQDRKIAFSYSQLQAIANKNSEGEVCYDLFVGEQSYFYRDYGELVYRKVAQYVLSQRAGEKDYPIFLTDLDLSSFTEQSSLVNYLDIKRQIEHKLNHVLLQLIS